MNTTSDNITKLNLRDVYVDNKLYLSKRETNCYFQKGLVLVKQFDASQNTTNANTYLPPAIVELKKSICVDRYNEDAKYVLNYASAQMFKFTPATDISNCHLDANACCALNNT
jgi:hypothetical protein